MKSFRSTVLQLDEGASAPWIYSSWKLTDIMRAFDAAGYSDIEKPVDYSYVGWMPKQKQHKFNFLYKDTDEGYDYQVSAVFLEMGKEGFEAEFAGMPSYEGDSKSDAKKAMLK